MLTSRKTMNPRLARLGFVFSLLVVLGLMSASATLAQQNTTTPTTITVSDTPITTNAKRLGVNLGTQDFWDSGLIMRNLAFRNPGFEAETWQTILHCQTVTASSCTDDNLYNYWPANFLNGGSASFIYGPATGSVATVTTSTAAVIGATGVTINLSGVTTAPSVGDYVVVRTNVPGNAQAGWWPQPSGGATVSTDTTDLSPNTPGKQALSINAAGAGQQVYLTNYDDGAGGRIYVKMSGNYNLAFRAKGTGGSNQVVITLVRNAASGTVQLWKQTVNLTNSWQDYNFPFSINNDVTSPGNIALTFNVYQSSMLIDDVAFTEAAAPNNPTAYRNAVVSTLQTLHPGTLRYMDSGINWGSSIDNILATDFARQRTGNSPHGSEIDDIAMGLHDFLVLCQTVGAEPWYTMPTGMTTQEMTNLMEYLGGSSSTTYGAKRAAMGQTAPWTSVFAQIHLEFGNEVWNTGNPGANMSDPTAYGKRAATIFATAKASPNYAAKKFDLVLDGFAAVSFWTQGALAASSGYDTVDIAPYNFNYFNDASSSEAVFGPMLAEPEYMNSDPNGWVKANATIAGTSGPTPAKLAFYEANIDANQGSVSQDAVNNAIPSLGAGLSVAANMLLAQRDNGVTVQNMFALEGIDVTFYGSTATSATTSPIWGVTIDMGGATDLRRPMYLSEELANMAILPTMFATSQSGTNPTWNQTFTANDSFSLPNAHFIQSMAYSDGTTLNIVLFNLSRTSALPVNFAGLNAPSGTATVNTLTAPAIDANNETQTNVAIATSSQSLGAGSVVSLPPYSMTVLSVPAPYIAPIVTGVTATCANSALSPSFTTTCTANVAGQGQYNSAFTWSASTGTVSSTGIYTPPATVPASGQAVVTATSTGDTTKSASYVITLATDTITGVTASCPATSVGQGKSINCTASVKGTGSFTGGYTWSTTAGSITPAGVLTAPATGTSVTITATSTQDQTKSGSVTLSVSPVLIISNLTYSVTGTTATVSWNLNMPANSAIAYGTSPSGGLNTPWNPSTTTSPSITLTGLQPSTTYYLAAYSMITGQAPTQYLTIKTSNGSTSVTGVSVNCTALSLLLGGSTGCAATVQGTGNYSSGVTWSASLGSISSTGVLTAPLTLLGSSITVTATSVTDPTKSGSVVVSLTPAATVTAVGLTCQATTLVDGSTTTCTPTVTGTGNVSTAVTFSASAGSITSTGVLTAPKTGTSVTVTATSVANPAKSASTVITLTPLPTITGVLVTCQASSLTVGGNTSCASSVTGTGSYTSAVTWSASAGSISSAGLLTTPSTGTSVTVTATSTQDPTKSGTAVITLNPALAITNPVITVTSTTVTVGWTLNNAQANSAVGYGAPGNVTNITPYSSLVTAQPSFTLTGFAPSSPVALVIQSWLPNGQSVSMNLSTTTAAASPTVTGVSVACAASSVLAGNSTACSASVAGTGKYTSTITWSASAGSITSSGVLTAPTTGTSVVVTATSTQDPTKSATTIVAVTPLPTVSGVTVTCPAGTLIAGSSATCSAAVSGTGNYSSAVTWSASAGSITPAGVLTTPTTGTTVYVKATSVQDSTKSAITSITLTPPTAVSSLSVTCPASAIAPGASTSCSVAVVGTGSYSSAVTWSASAGTITSAGLLTAPATGTTITVKATSVQDSTKSATTTVQISQNIAIVNPIISVTSTTIVVHWTVTQSAHNAVKYGLTTAYGAETPYQSTSTTNPSFTFTGLQPGTTYYGQLVSTNSSGTATYAVSVTTPLK